MREKEKPVILHEVADIPGIPTEISEEDVKKLEELEDKEKENK